MSWLKLQEMQRDVLVEVAMLGMRAKRENICVRNEKGGVSVVMYGGER